eukprot:g1009.t1
MEDISERKGTETSVEPVEEEELKKVVVENDVKKEEEEEEEVTEIEDSSAAGKEEEGHEKRRTEEEKRDNEVADTQEHATTAEKKEDEEENDDDDEENEDDKEENADEEDGEIVEVPTTTSTNIENNPKSSSVDEEGKKEEEETTEASHSNDVDDEKSERVNGESEESKNVEAGNSTACTEPTTKNSPTDKAVTSDKVTTEEASAAEQVSVQKSKKVLTPAEKLVLRQKVSTAVESFQTEFLRMSFEERKAKMVELRAKNDELIERTKGKTAEEIQNEGLVTTDDSINVTLVRLANQVHWRLALKERLEGKSKEQVEAFFKDVTKKVMSFQKRLREESAAISSSDGDSSTSSAPVPRKKYTDEEVEAMEFYKIRMAQVIPLTVTIPPNFNGQAILTLIPPSLMQRGPRGASPIGGPGRYFIQIPVPQGKKSGETFDYTIERRDLHIQEIPSGHKAGDPVVVKLAWKKDGKDVILPLRIGIARECKPGDKWCLELSQLLKAVRGAKKNSFELKKTPEQQQQRTSTTPAESNDNKAPERATEEDKAAAARTATSSSKPSLQRSAPKKSAKRKQPVGSYKHDAMVLGAVAAIGLMCYAAWQWTKATPRRGMAQRRRR